MLRECSNINTIKCRMCDRVFIESKNKKNIEDIKIPFVGNL